jgi:hypothetical protein
MAKNIRQPLRLLEPMRNLRRFKNCRPRVGRERKRAQRYPLGGYGLQPPLRVALLT